MTLGALIARLENESDTAEAIGALGDLPLYAELAAMAERFGEAPGEYVAAGAARFANEAGEEDWLSLIAAVERAANPGQAALARLVRWALERDRKGWQSSTAPGCSCVDPLSGS